MNVEYDNFVRYARAQVVSAAWNTLFFATSVTLFKQYQSDSAVCMEYTMIYFPAVFSMYTTLIANIPAAF